MWILRLEVSLEFRCINVEVTFERSGSIVIENDFIERTGENKKKLGKECIIGLISIVYLTHYSERTDFRMSLKSCMVLIVGAKDGTGNSRTSRS